MPECVICGKVYDRGRELTCFEGCHEQLVERLIARFGEYKKVVRMRTGVAYKVPTKDIVELGLREQELDRYPVWTEESNAKATAYRR